MDYDALNPLLIKELQSFEKFFDADSDLRDNFQGEIVNAETALHVIEELSKSGKFDAEIPFLAVNYFNRFILREDLKTVQSGVQGSLNLFAFSFLSIAWKMKKKPISTIKFLEDLWKCMEKMETIWKAKSEIDETSSSAGI